MLERIHLEKFSLLENVQLGFLSWDTLAIPAIRALIKAPHATPGRSPAPALTCRFHFDSPARYLLLEIDHLLAKASRDFFSGIKVIIDWTPSSIDIFRRCFPKCQALGILDLESMCDYEG
jgi:hypothetical protein